MTLVLMSFAVVFTTVAIIAGAIVSALDPD